MSKPTNNKGAGQGTIAVNKRARFEYHIEERIEAGVSLLGWELKAIRAGKLQFGESYALIKDGEIFLFGAQISPLLSASTHIVPEAMRNRKLLLHKA
ncbi:MAG: SsrA-binding protein, partial [Xanthomonadales bacterium]|nr:SsrA-binding protein [Xanthomonadales bacterium]